MTRHINDAGLNLVKKYEGLKLRAYRCPAGVWTVGYGSTKGVHEGMVITQDEADRRLRDDLGEAERAVETLVTAPLHDNEFAALVSFVFNLGAGAFAKSTLRKLINEKQNLVASLEFKRWNKAGGKVLPGLVARRAEERTLFLTRDGDD